MDMDPDAVDPSPDATRMLPDFEVEVVPVTTVTVPELWTAAEVNMDSAPDVPDELDPESSDTEPPVRAGLSPADTTMFPPEPEEVVPATILMGPALPLAPLDPVWSTIAPEFPCNPLPVLSMRNPELPTD